MTDVNVRRRNTMQDEFDRAVNVTQWLCGYLGDPANEQDLRSIMGQGPKKPHEVKYALVQAAEPYGVKEVEIGSAIKSLASGW